MIEFIGTGIGGMGLLLFVGCFIEKESDSQMYGIAIALIVIGLFIASLGS
jgi:hypothetical protein